MSRRRVTDIGVKNLKPRAQPYEAPLGNRLYASVQPTGHRTFTFRYAHPPGGKRYKVTLKAGISLAAAMREAADMAYQLERGINPAIARREQRQEVQRALADTLRAVCEEYFRREGGKLRCAKERRRLLNRLVLPALGDMPIRQIRRSDIIRLLDKIEEQNGPAASQTALAALRVICNWHAVRDDAFMSPIVRGMTRRRGHEHARSRILDDAELRAVWQAAEADTGLFGPLVQFLLLTSARLREASNMAWAELQGADWTLPESRNKTKLPLFRPLSAAAQDVLARLPRAGEFVFSTGRRPIGGMEWRKARFDKQCGVTGWVLHDLRRMARSLMSRAGVTSDHAERCLGHVIGGVRGTYDRYEYRREKQQAFEALAAQLDRIVRPRDNVTALPARG
jgi:Arm DNA-binding domain